ncbi:MAG TPA: caspase family protein [Pyrinomonadaceae bacterium]|jgi:ribosomal protein L12E/L44/L45/RPP1/RPP2
MTFPRSRHNAFPVAALICAALSLTALSVWSPTPAAQPPQTQQTQTQPPKPQPPSQGRGIGRELETQAHDRALKLIQTLPGKTKRYALVVGVDQYTDPQVVGLSGAANDARILTEALVRNAGFPRDQVILLASNQPPERQPTRGNILRRLSNLAAAVPKDGLLLFSFAGHGIERNNQAFLLPSDAQVSDDVRLLEQTAINVVQIKEWIHGTGVGQVLLLLDACRNDPAAGRANADNPLTNEFMRGFNFDVRNREVQAFATIYATDVGRRAYEQKEQQHGYFTLALVEGLQGRAANTKGEVTLQGLVKYLQDTVPRRVTLDLGQGKVQRPLAVIEGYRADELVLAVGDPNAPVATSPEASASTGTRATNAERSQGENSSPPERSAEEEEGSLADTVWRGLSPEAGAYTIEFLKGGTLRYSFNALENGKHVLKTTGGTWQQLDNTVQISVGDYSVLQGTIAGGTIKGEGNNVDGLKWNFTLLRKKQ